MNGAKRVMTFQLEEDTWNSQESHLRWAPTLLAESPLRHSPVQLSKIPKAVEVWFFMASGQLHFDFGRVFLDRSTW